MIDFAEAESAVADAFLVDQDDERTELGPWRDGLDRLTTGVLRLAGRRLPDRFRRSLDLFIRHVPLLPLPGGGETWRRPVLRKGSPAMRSIPGNTSMRRSRWRKIYDSSAFVCIGLRSIGAVLASVVAASLRRRGRCVATRSCTPARPSVRSASGDGSGPASVHRRSVFVHLSDCRRGPRNQRVEFAALEALTGAGVSGDRIALLPAWRAYLVGAPVGARATCLQRSSHRGRYVTGATDRGGRDRRSGA